MKRFLLLLLFGWLSLASVQAQFAKPLKTRNYTCRNTSSLSVGLTGSFAANDMLYSSVSKAMLRPMLAPTFGIAAEWNTMQRISLGLDASYAMHGTNEVFATEFLTSYSTTSFARIRYSVSMTGVEVRIPITYYLGYGENIRPYVFVAPRFDLWLKGGMKWTRTYDNDSYAPVEYEIELNDATMAPCDVSAMAGVGLCSRLLLNRTRLFVKLEFSYGISMLSNFSQLEVDKAVEFLGWGDIQHETLGERRLQNLEARLTMLMPLRKHLNGACTFNQNKVKPKQ